MLTDVQIINLGVSKIASNRIKRIDPPSTAVEEFMAAGYPQWKRSELAKRRWVFALVDDYSLTVSETLTGVDKPYKYALPIDCLRPVRLKRTEWKQRGRFIHSAYDTLKLSYVKNAAEAEFDVLFIDVLAARVALESVEYITQSNTKKEHAQSLYNMAVMEAAKANAFVTGPEDIQEDDEVFDWMVSRHG